MRYLLGFLLIVLTGCGASAPITAHGKPVPFWVDSIRAPDVKLRLQAVRALGNVGAKDPAVLPTLIIAIKDKEAAVRVEATLALLRMGPAARDAIPALTEARRDADARVRESAAKALDKIQAP